MLRSAHVRPAESAAATRGIAIMTRGLIVLMTAAAMGAATCRLPPRRVDGGGVAAGVIGGLAVGTMLGAAAAQPRYYLRRRSTSLRRRRPATGPAARRSGTAIAAPGCARAFRSATRQRPRVGFRSARAVCAGAFLRPGGVAPPAFPL